MSILRRVTTNTSSDDSEDQDSKGQAQPMKNQTLLSICLGCILPIVVADPLLFLAIALWCAIFSIDNGTFADPFPRHDAKFYIVAACLVIIRCYYNYFVIVAVILSTGLFAYLQSEYVEFEKQILVPCSSKSKANSFDRFFEQRVQIFARNQESRKVRRKNRKSYRSLRY